MTSSETVTPGSVNPPGYLELLRKPGALSFAVPGVIGRFSLATRSFTAALLIQEVTGSYGKAGIVGGAITLVAAIASPRLSRIADAHGTRLLMVATLALHLAAGAGLIVAAYRWPNLPMLLLMASLLGLSSVSFGAISRAAWTRVAARGPELDRAFAFEAISEDVAFIVGPSAAVPLTLSVHPAGGLIASLLLTVIASAWLYRLPDRLIRRPVEVNSEMARTAKRRQSIFSIPGLRILLVALFFFGLVFGAIELMLVAFAREAGNEPMATLLLVMMAVGSCIGGLTYGAIRWRLPEARRMVLLQVAFALGLVPIIFVTTIPLMAIVILASGIFISPAIIAGMTITERLTPREIMTESFAWIGSSISVGAAAGIFAGGRLIDSYGANGAQVLVVASGIVSVAIVFLYRGLLVPQPEHETA